MGFIKEIVQFKIVMDIILFVLLILFVIFPQVWGGECNFNNPNCDYDAYCGIDNQCHKFMYKDNILEEKKQTERSQPIFIPMLISVALVTGAYWYKENDKKQ
jgi:hypothetical protein